MRRWSVRAVQPPAWRRLALRCTAVFPPHPPHARSWSFSARSCQAEQPANHRTPFRQYAIFQKIDRPDDSVDAWIALLDGALPPHLRDWSKSTEPPVLSAVDVAELLLAAQYPQDAAKPYDVLYHLAFGQGRWSAVVWLIKRLVETFPVRHTRQQPLCHVSTIWDAVSSLKDFTEFPSSAVLEEVAPDEALVAERRSLDQLTVLGSNAERAMLDLGHDALGQVWRTLGEMTKACAGGDIRAEVLEIIAYLHHKEVMPMSIYRAEPHPDASAVQQSPLLSILSSRILTSLSDAAWRAHEKLVVEEAKSQGAKYAALRPEVPGSVYRVNVTGLRPELWLELILWSCIEGGWTLPGLEILCSIARDKHWKPLSWKEYEKTIPAAGHTNTPEWALWEHAYKTRETSRMDAPRRPIMKIQHTVSAEVVNAYIDALANHIELGTGNKGVAFRDVLCILHELKGFLRQTGSYLDLSFGSWDALITRLLESQTIVPEQDAGETQELQALMVGFGPGNIAKNTQDQPAYLRDGNLAMQGLLHRALYGQIMAGSLEGALTIFRQIQTRADLDKIKSIRVFIERRVMKKLIQHDLFTSNYAGIDYPAFKIQIPTTILGSLLELVTDAKEYEFGRWLLYNDEVDGPVIGESLYGDRFIQPAVIRFAAASNDRTLLAKFTEQRVLRDSYRAVLDTQVDMCRWDAALRILEHLADTEGRKWSIRNLANVARAALLRCPLPSDGKSSSGREFDNARMIFRQMVLGKFSGKKATSQRKQIHVQSVLAVLCAIDSNWATFCLGLRQGDRHRPFVLKASNFNIILEGVIDTYGSAAGRRLLEIFWPHSARSAHDAAIRLGRHLSSRIKVPRSRSTVLQSTARQRISIKISGDDGDDDKHLIMYGVLTPNVNTILIILRQALKEVKETQDMKVTNDVEPIGNDPKVHHNDDDEYLQDTSPRSMVRWAVRRLAELPYVDWSITRQLDKTLLEYGMDEVRSELPDLLGEVEAELMLDVEKSTESDAHEDDPSASLPEPVNVA